MKKPFFVPISGGDCSAMASIPSGPLMGPPVVILPGLENSRVRDAADHFIVGGLADRGRPVLQLDFPGRGSSPGTPTDFEELDQVAVHACEWFADECGSDGFSVIGVCGSALLAFQVTELSRRVEEVISISCPVAGREGAKLRPQRIRKGLAAIDPVGVPLMATLRRRPAPTAPDELLWRADLLAQLGSMSESTRVLFLYGEADPQFPDFLELQRSGSIPDEAMGRWDVRICPGDELYGYSTMRVRDWLTASVIGWLVSNEEGESVG
jgi:pimeloyl-ACP methyl ester carboxylesterase